MAPFAHRPPLPASPLGLGPICRTKKMHKMEIFFIKNKQEIKQQ